MKPIKTLRVSISGIRGVVGDTLKPSLVARFAQSFATYLGPGSFIVGRDTRTSGEMMKHAVFAGLLSTGARVVDVDICPVPTIQLAVRTLQGRGGIAITASHNPAEWNALKFIHSSGCFLNPHEAEELVSLYHQPDLPNVTSDQLHSPEAYENAVQDHLDRIGRLLGSATQPPLRVVVDCCNGAGSVMAPQLLRTLGCEVIEMHTTPDGLFPRSPEPVPENLGALCQKVLEEQADVGFAQDPDADRLAVVSEKGVAIGEEYTLALALLGTLQRERGAVVCNLSTSRMIDEIAARFECPCYRSRIGEVNVTEMMLERDALIGGEGNGGVIFPRVNMARDSFVAMTLILQLMRDSGKGVSQLIRELPRYRISKSVYEVHPHRVHQMLDNLAHLYEHETLNRLDGLKIDREEGWIHIRPSNTEPILRMVVEARSQLLVDQFRAEFEGRIQQHQDG